MMMTLAYMSGVVGLLHLSTVLVVGIVGDSGGVK